MTPLRVTHVINGLDTGGAEMTLWRLLAHSNRERFHHNVVSLTGLGPMAERIVALGIDVSALGLRRGPSDIAAPLRLAPVLRGRAPDLVQTWMYHADLIGGLAAKLAVDVPVIWNLRQSNLEPGSSKRTTIWTRRLCARLSSRVPDRIVCCAEAVRELHVRLGYADDKMVVISNGIDATAFHADGDARAALRNELGVARDAVLIGALGRWDRQKDYATFVAAAAILAANAPAARFLLCGADLDRQNAELADLVSAVGLQEKFSLLGRRDDATKVCAALDVGTSSSAYGEGFPNAVAEMMSCSVPCVVTDVGESATLVGGTGRAVAVRAPEALARAWMEMLKLGPKGRAELGAVARKRIVENFGLAEMVARYEALYEERAAARRRAAR
jgi:glycosyltransferase involved in cell wall biosynthesis